MTEARESRPIRIRTSFRALTSRNQPTKPRRQRDQKRRPLSSQLHNTRHGFPRTRPAHCATVATTNTDIGPPILHPTSTTAPICLDPEYARRIKQVDRIRRQRFQQRTCCRQGSRCCYFWCVTLYQKENMNIEVGGGGRYNLSLD